MSLHQFKSKEKIVREEKRQEILETLIQRDVENNNGKVSKYIISHYDVSEEDAKKVIALLGNENTLIYTRWFFLESQLDRDIYIMGAEKVAEGYVNINELKNSSLDFLFRDVQDSIKRFNLTKKQLEQKEYKRIDQNTGTRRSAENPYSSDHSYEHLDSRLDRSSRD